MAAESLLFALRHGNRPAHLTQPYLSLFSLSLPLFRCSLVLHPQSMLRKLNPAAFKQCTNVTV